MTFVLKSIFPFPYQFKSFFKTESEEMIEQNLRDALNELGSEEFYKRIQEIKKGESVLIGSKTYSKHNTRSISNAEPVQEEII